MSQMAAGEPAHLKGQAFPFEFDTRLRRVSKVTSTRACLPFSYCTFTVVWAVTRFPDWSMHLTVSV